DPTISITPSSSTVCVGGTVTLTATPSNGTGTCTIQWQSGTSSTGPWTNIGGANGTTYSAPTSTVGIMYYRTTYTCTGSGCDPAASNASLVVVIQDPSITINPPANTVCVGGSLTLLATINGGADVCTIQWQSRTSSTGPWTNIPNTNSLAYSPAVSTPGVTYYRATYTCTGSGCDAATSNVASVTVEPDPTVSITPSSATVCVGGMVTLNATVSGGAGICGIQWQQSDNGLVWTNIPAETAATYAAPTTTAGTKYYRVIYSCNGGGCDAATSNTATVVVVADPTIIDQPNGASFCESGSHTLSVTATGGTPNLVYQWQSSPNGIVWTNIASANAASYTTPVLTSTMQYRVIVSATGDGCGTATSAAAIVMIYPPATVNAGPDQTICAIETVTLAGVRGGSATSSTWTTNGTGTFNNANALNAIYTPSAADIAAGTVTLTLTTNDPAGPCPAVSDQMIVTIRATGSLGNFVWEDLNYNGLQETGEPGIDGVTVRLYADVNQDGTPDGAAIATQTTAGGGFYNFPNLCEGNYIIEFATPAGGYISTVRLNTLNKDPNDSDADQVTGRTGSIPLASGENDPSNDAGFYRRASLGDFAWNDYDRDGQQDSNEPGIQNIRVRLYRDSNQDGTPDGPFIASQLTDANGYYLFPNLDPGAYIVEFVPLPGFTVTLQNTGPDATDSDINPAGRTGTIVLISNQNDLTVDGGFFQAASLGDYVWEDLNRDGIQQGNEPGINGVTVRLYEDANQDGTPDGPAIATQTTAGGGFYNFTNLQPGNYVIQFMPLAGYFGTLQLNTINKDATDSDANPATGFTGSIPLASGENDPSNDAGFYRLASLGDYVWEDLDGDGRQDGNEPGIQGVTVRLFVDANQDGTPDSATPLATQTTGLNGEYLFTGLIPGGYVVQFVPADTDYKATLQNVGSDDLDSDVNPATGYTGTIVLESNETDLTVDAGFSRYDLALTKVLASTTPGPFQQGSTVAFDITVTNEGGINANNVIVTDRVPAGLTITGFNALASGAVNNGNGTFTIPSLPIGASRTFRVITQIAPNFQGFTLTNEAEITTDDGDDIDSTPNNDVPTEDDQDEVTIPVSQTASVDIEKYTNGRDADTYADAVIILIPNSPIPTVVWTYTVTNTGTLNLSNLVVTDDEEGAVCTIPFLAAGASTTCTKSAPAMRGTYDNVGTVVAQPVDVNNNPTGGTVTDSDPSNYVGLYINVDKQADKTEICAGETVTFTLTVRMLGGGPGLQLRDISVVDDNLPVGTMLMPYDSRWLGGDLNGNGYIDFIDNNNDGISDEEFVWTYSLVYNSTTTNTAMDEASVWFNGFDTGLMPMGMDMVTVVVNPNRCASIGDFVWDDYDRDGQQDGNEPGIPNVWVRLFADANQDGTPDSATPLQSVQTGPNGEYLFGGLIPGNYVVRFDTPAGFTPTTANQGPDATDSDAGVGGYTATIPLVNGQNITTIDAGFYRAASLGDYVWLDLNGNGLQDDGPTGVPNVTVNLLDGNGVFIRDTQTDATGFYQFTDLQPGNYIVEFEAPTGTVFTLANQGGNPANDSDANQGTGRSNVIALASGENNPTIDAGLYPPINIDLNKTFVSAVLQPNGSYNVTYTIAVTNLGGPGQYDLRDMPGFDDDIAINSANFTSTVPTNGALAGIGPWTLANDQAIVAFATHTYTLVVNVTLNTNNGIGNDTYTACGSTNGTPRPGEALFNRATVDTNNDGTPEDTAEACGELPNIILDKTFVSATVQPNGSYNVVYTIAVTNNG
ncbi:MAG TPA: SdrD B-like domain-containing protein, partial [Saprospiraceae bacterium]|nr:SdrD B-like domain-containing protein [Saprospiraceae bacterium]